MKQNGSFRKGTITKYHNTGDVREDKSEGILENRISGPGYLSNEQAKAFLGKDVKSVTFREDWKGSLAQKKNLPKGYMACASSSYGKHLFARFKADSYFIIKNVPKFIDAIARAVSEHLKFEFIVSDKVTYVKEKERKIKVGELVRNGDLYTNPSLADYFVKNKLYAIESEFRIVALTDHNTISESLYLTFTKNETMECFEFPA